jgi:hypothetical protein
MPSTLQIFDANTILKIRSKLLQDSFLDALEGPPEVIVERIGGKLIDSGITFRPEYQLELPSAGTTAWDEIAMANTEVVHAALPGLNAFAASRDELWATLCFGHYRPYVQRVNLPYSQQDGDLRRNFRLHYLSSTIRNRWRDNTISRLWWLRNYAERIMPEDPNMALSVLFFRDKNVGESLLTKPSISLVPTLGKALLRLTYEHFIYPGTTTYNRDALRHFITEVEINNSGRKLMETLDQEEVTSLLTAVFEKSYLSRQPWS